MFNFLCNTNISGPIHISKDLNRLNLCLFSIQLFNIRRMSTFFADLSTYIGNAINIPMSVILKGHLIMPKDELRECKQIVSHNRFR